MLRPTLLNFFFFWLVKYGLLYIFLMIKNQDFALTRINSLNDAESYFYYLFLLLFMPFICMLIFSTPFYFSFKLRNGICQIMILILVLEYFVYTYFASPSDKLNGIFGAAISLLVLISFFYKYIPCLTKS